MNINSINSINTDNAKGRKESGILKGALAANQKIYDGRILYDNISEIIFDGSFRCDWNNNVVYNEHGIVVDAYILPWGITRKKAMQEIIEAKKKEHPEYEYEFHSSPKLLMGSSDITGREYSTHVLYITNWDKFIQMQCDVDEIPKANANLPNGMKDNAALSGALSTDVELWYDLYNDDFTETSCFELIRDYLPEKDIRCDFENHIMYNKNGVVANAYVLTKGFEKEEMEAILAVKRQEHPEYTYEIKEGSFPVDVDIDENMVFSTHVLYITNWSDFITISNEQENIEDNSRNHSAISKRFKDRFGKNGTQNN